MASTVFPLISFEQQQPRRIWKFRARTGFTLIELLAVMAIVVTMVAIAVPAFTGIAKGSSLKAGGGSVSNLALLARQNSLSRNAMTALVMIGAAGTDADFRAFSLYEITPHPDGSPVVATDWKQIAAWDILRDGVAVDACTFNASSVPMTPPFPPLYYHNASISAYQYVVFLPTGALASTAPAHVRLAPGFIPSGSQAISYTTKLNGGQPANYYDISIVAANGRVKVDRP